MLNTSHSKCDLQRPKPHIFEMFLNCVAPENLHSVPAKHNKTHMPEIFVTIAKQFRVVTLKTSNTG